MAGDFLDQYLGTMQRAGVGDVLRLAREWQEARDAACRAPLGDGKVWMDLGRAETALSAAVTVYVKATGEW